MKRNDRADERSIVTIASGELSVALDPAGAVLHSVIFRGCEYLWQGDPKYWPMRDANLFPYIGRLNGGQYIYRGKKYSMDMHGFCIGRRFSLEHIEADRATFLLRSSAELKESYPFDFELRIGYRLKGSTIEKSCAVRNIGGSTMFFALGSHPGFRVPLDGAGSFEDWVVEFDRPCSPSRILFDPISVLRTGEESPFALKDGRYLPLRHELFDRDAIVLRGTSGSVSLRSSSCSRGVTVSCPGMPILAFWHSSGTDAPFLCIEPWLTLPSHEAYVEDIEKQEGLIPLAAGEEYLNVIEISLE